MYQIFQVLGTPQGDDISFVTDQKAVAYLKSFPIIDIKSVESL